MLLTFQGSRVWPFWSHMRPNFSMVWQKKFWGRTSATSRLREKKVSATLKVSLWFNNRHTLGPYHGLNQSEIVKGGPPPLIGHGPDIRLYMYVWKCVCCCSQTKREVSSRDAHSVTNLATFQTPQWSFFPKKRLVTNLATYWTNFSESLWYS